MHHKIFNKKDPDQTTDLGPYSLKYRLPWNISRRAKQTTKVAIGGLKISYHHMDIYKLLNILELKNNGCRKKRHLISIKEVLYI